ncbi:MAG: glycerophosphodiester phosphodiesterase [Opitutaceae bacterium]|nr:glycerophosphodiester phosphodiesterase [Opitutaceae bacterium]
MKPILPPTLLFLFAASALFAAPQIVAHRGASHDAPENTVAAAKLAWAQGADAVEIDIWLSKDGEAVVMHDATTKRTAGKDAPVVAQTLAELRQLDAGSWKNPTFAREKVPTLDELLATLPREPGKRIFIEIKTGPEIVPAMVAAIRRARLTPAQTVIISFKYDSLVASKKALPDYAALWLLGKPSTDPKKKSPTLDEVIRDCRAAQLDGLDLNHGWPLDSAAVKKIRDAKLQLHVWTVDDLAIARHWTALGVDSITTNRPGWLREQLRP